MVTIRKVLFAKITQHINIADTRISRLQFTNNGQGIVSAASIDKKDFPIISNRAR